MTTPGPIPLIHWLRAMRRTNEKQNDLVNLHFDLDGAIEAGQLELAWRSRNSLVCVCLELYLDACGVRSTADGDAVDVVRACAAVRALARIDPAMAQQTMSLLTQPAPPSADGLAEEIDAVRRFLADKLSLPAAASRGVAMRVWADGVKVLREVAGSVGLAQDDGWYLREAGAADLVDWYDEVLSAAAAQNR